MRFLKLSILCIPNYASSIVITQEVTDALLGDRPLAQSSSAMGDAHG
jgi:hypothetical protein